MVVMTTGQLGCNQGNENQPDAPGESPAVDGGGDGASSPAIPTADESGHSETGAPSPADSDPAPEAAPDETIHQLGGWKRLEVDGALLVTLDKGKRGIVRLKGPEDARSSIQARVQDGVLRIEPNTGNSMNLEDVAISVSLPTTIEGLRIAGASELRVAAGLPKTKQLSVELSDAARLVTKRVNASVVQATLSGTSTWTVGEVGAKRFAVKAMDASVVTGAHGSVEDLGVKAGGAVSVRLESLEAKSGDVRVSDSADVWVHATETLVGAASEASTLHYAGGAQVTVKVQDAAGLRPIGT